ncbi:phospholipase D [Actinoallomurus acanthiterrae]
MEPYRSNWIDRVEQELGDLDPRVHAVSTENRIRIIDTPRMWGRPMNQSSATACAIEAIRDMAETVETMLIGGRQVIDIVSLNPPSGAFLTAIQRGLLALNGRKVTVRFLYGFVPVEGTVEAFVRGLKDFCRQNKLDTTQMTILVGELYKPKAGFWNHAKIVAVDGTVALVGGHNLWAESYGTYPPVHDISVQVIGAAAKHAQEFANWCWNVGGDNLTVRKVNATWGTDTIDPGLKRNQMCVIDISDQHYAPVPGANHNWTTGKMLSLGRGGLLGCNASDVAKEMLIKGAQRTLKICQQDLVFTGYTAEKDHKACYWIAEALIQNQLLKVDIVVSPIGGATHGAQYSWGWGASGTYALIKSIIESKFPSKLRDEAALQRILARLQVAPFCFTQVQFAKEGEDYLWPTPPATAIVGRFGRGDKLPSGSYNPAPGNHAKVYIADDACFYIGSDNLYPHDLAEFGYLVEGPAVADLLAGYWTPVWQYSSPHKVT